MIVIGPVRSSWLKVFKNPTDAQAPYRADLRLPDGRRYSARMRSHPAGNTGAFWYEGFVTAVHADDYARDQQLIRYPVEPRIVPARWDLLPCQIKINPYPVGQDRSQGLIGTIWVSRQNGAQGGELFTVLARKRHGGSLVIAGEVMRYRQQQRDKLDVRRSPREIASAA